MTNDRKKSLSWARKVLAEENRRFGKSMESIPVCDWPDWVRDTNRVGVWRSRDFLVQVFDEPEHPLVAFRLSVCRAAIGNDGRWKDGLTWDELQWIKAGCGYGDLCSVEVFPPDDMVVNVANMRHLWVLKGCPEFMWRTDSVADVQRLAGSRSGDGSPGTVRPTGGGAE